MHCTKSKKEVNKVQFSCQAGYVRGLTGSVYWHPGVTPPAVAVCQRLRHSHNMTLLIARHGQTDWNRLGRWQSRSDVPLNDAGRAQAKGLRDILRARELYPSRIICSPLQRAQETASLLAEDTNVQPETESLLVELNLGEFEGRFEQDIRAADPAAYARWRETCYLEAAPGGESILDVADRIAPFLEVLDDSAGDILVVGHQGVNMAMKAQLSDCFSVECLMAFRQGNDEIDLWDFNPPRSIGRLRTRALA